MLYLATASGPKAVEAIRSGELGQICQPRSNKPVDGGDGIVWAADNGCFADTWDAAMWLRWLDGLPRTALWATVPDVVGDHAATVALWDVWAGIVAAAGFRPAFVAQNGCSGGLIPSDAGAVFIGGDDAYKTSDDALSCVREAQSRHIPTHMGRVNSRRRYRVATRWAVDTVDGTFLTYGPDKNLPRLRRWFIDSHQQTLNGVAAVGL